MNCSIIPQSISLEEFLAIKSATITSAALSTLGSAFIMLTFHLTRTHRPLSLHLVYLLSLADCGSSLIYIFDALSPSDELTSACSHTAFCQFKGALSQFFGLAAILWTFAIGTLIHYTVIGHAHPPADPARLLRQLQLGVWGTATLCVCILLPLGMFGAAGGWCWIVPKADVARLLVFYLPLLSTLGYNFYVFVKTRKVLLSLLFEARRSAHSSEQLPPLSEQTSALPSLTARLRNLLLIFAFIHSFQIVNRIYDYIAPSSPSAPLLLLHATFGPLQGLGNALVYGWSPRFRRLWAAKISALCPRLGRVQPGASPDASASTGAKSSSTDSIVGGGSGRGASSASADVGGGAECGARRGAADTPCNGIEMSEIRVADKGESECVERQGSTTSMFEVEVRESAVR